MRLPRADEMPKPPKEVFLLATPEHMLRKLYWELSNVHRALRSNPKKIGYVHAPAWHAFNFAVTAWHMTDWVWESFTEGMRDEFSSRNVQVRTDKEFQAVLTRQSRDLYICMRIANGSKHKRLRKPDATVGAQGYMRFKTSGAKGVTARLELVIQDQDKLRPATEVFLGVRNYWHDFLAQWGFSESRHIV